MLNFVPGENTISAEFHYQPDDANDTIAQGFLHEFIQTGNSLILSIKGDPSSSPYPSLVPALEGVSLSSGLTGESKFYRPPVGSHRHGTLQGLNFPPIITHINVHIPPSAIIDNLVFIDFDVSHHQFSRGNTH